MLIHKSLLCSRFSSSTIFLAAIDRTHSFKNIIGQPQSRNVWKFTHVYMPERTPDGLAQRPPTDHPDFQKYTCYFDEEFNNPAPPFKIILLEDIEELGEKFDIVEAEPDIARRAILEKKASYASPFDLEYYGRKKKEWLASEEGKKFKIPRELTKFGKELANKIIPVLVSMTIEWTLNVEMLAISLQKAGINVPIESVHLAIPADGPIKGPNLNEDARLFRFYIIIDDQMIVPMLGRLTHVSTEETNLFPSEEKFQNAPTDPQQLAQFGLRPETLYYNVNGIAETIDGKDVAKFMGARPSDAVTGVN